MVCSNCGNNMEPDERYCSKCGTDSQQVRVPVAPVQQSSGTNWDTHVKVIAWIFIITALFIVIPGTFLMAFMGTFSHMMLPRGPLFFRGPILGLFSLMFLPVPIGIAAAGIGLLKYREWARILTVIFAAFMLMGFPFGTALGIYALWVLLSTGGSSFYKAHAATTA